MPIALGKYLFPFRTQKSSPVAPIILHQRETRKVPIIRNPPERVDFCCIMRAWKKIMLYKTIRMIMFRKV